MKKYISYQDYLTIHPTKKGYEADEISRMIVAHFAAKASTDMVFTKGPDSTDIILTNQKGVKFSIECKDRSWNGYQTTSFNDHMIEAIKLKSLIKRKQRGEFDRLFLASLYIDGGMKISKDIDKTKIREAKMLCPETTTFGERKMVLKDCVFYQQDVLKYFAIIIDTEDPNYFSVKFFDSPVDIAKLNCTTYDLFE